VNETSGVSKYFYYIRNKDTPTVVTSDYDGEPTEVRKRVFVLLTAINLYGSYSPQLAAIESIRTIW
jgi:hypothetical protein